MESSCPPVHTGFRKVFRAHLDDVENLSYGKGAKKRRTGSRFTCHRLNRDERRIFDQAKRDGFLTVRGTGYRKNRKGSPVANTFRQRCDALAKICVVVEKRSDSDRVVIDFSTLRVRDDSALTRFLIETVFRPNHNIFYEALIAQGHNVQNCRGVAISGNSEIKKDDCSVDTSMAENTTCCPIDWDSVRSKPIWGVDARILAVACDREVARSIAIDAVKAGNCARFARLQADAEKGTDDRDLSLESPIEMATTRPTNQQIDCNDNHGKRTNFESDDDCIDWNDI